MGKKLDEYKEKSNKIINTFRIIGIFIFILGILISIVQYTLSKAKENKALMANTDSEFVIDLKDNSIVYKKETDINIAINNYDKTKKYNVRIDMDSMETINEELGNKNNKLKLKFDSDGKKQIKFSIAINGVESYNCTKTVYYIEPYKKQFLEENENNGVVMHIRDGTRENYLTSIDLLKKAGGTFVREDFLLLDKFLKKRDKDFEIYDKWINKINDEGLKILLIINCTDKTFSGEDCKINTDEEIDKCVEIAKIIANRYNFIEDFELINEPNAKETTAYKTEEDLYFYSKLLKKITEELYKINPKISVSSGGTTTYQHLTKNTITSEDFINLISQNTQNKSMIYGYHPYDNTNKEKQNGDFYNLLDNHFNLFSNLGGFLKSYITEYGVSSSESYKITEEIQAQKLVQQTTILDKYGVELAIQYNMWNTTSDTYYSIRNYGLLHNDYTPKLSYYSMKNYYQNTNGSEYIGSLNIQSGLEAHVYNKDGKPLIIAWSDNTNNTYDFKLNSMTAKDLYGKDITPDENGNIQITTSPVYLYNVGTNYFYQAISNVSMTKYDEFIEKFKDEISKVSGLKTSIENLKNQMQSISNNSSLNEQTAINLMKEHYKLGDTIIQSYKSKTLQVEYVKLSSMLDMLDDIGDSFEDLVTVSAKTRNSNLKETKNLITTTENLINNNQDLEIIYPTKILQFSKDFYEKADYINGLKEENDIKTGLIVSKNLHSNLLASWANGFTGLYIDKYIENNPVEIEYSVSTLTNQSVTATLKTNAEITVTNNQNSKSHLFTENGEFTFEYTIKGRNFTKKATVTNIDKTPPAITGIENNGFYTTKVIPKVIDSNLQDIKLYKDSNLITNYSANSEISADGAYKIEATDKAGNKATVSFDICANPATISYSETNPTNKNVMATIVSNYDIQVTNNSNQKQYTFTKNGTYTFNYKIKTKEFNITAKVDWIDKEAPIITGIENNKLYIDQAVIPNVSDENLNEVKLYLNSIQVKNYKSGNKLTEEGFYKLVANDRAGNKTEVNFNIIKNNSKEYKVKGRNIINITGNTTKAEFTKNFNGSGLYQIARNGQAISNTDFVATGDILKSNNGDEYTLIVTGDVNKDGVVDISDLVRLKMYLIRGDNLDGLELLAADCNLDGEDISIADFVKMRLIIITKSTT